MSTTRFWADLTSSVSNLTSRYSGRFHVSVLAAIFLFALTLWTMASPGQRIFGKLSLHSISPAFGSAASLNPRIVIVMSDSRAPFIEDSPEKELTYWTLAALNNHLYAKSLGVPFVYYQLAEQFEEDGETVQMDVGSPKRSPAFCHHPQHGWRPAPFCKLLSSWHAWKSIPSADHLIFIDSDAIFKSRKNNVQRHLDLLSRRSPIGFVGNQPYDKEPCTGYFFMSRGSPVTSLGNDTGFEFLEDWWNADWASTGWHYAYEQSTLQKIVRERSQSEETNAIVLREEWQFEDRSPQQMVIHSNHLFKGRQSHILGQFWDWPGYDLNDRKQMKELLKEVEIRTVDMGQVEAEVDLASKSRVVES